MTDLKDRFHALLADEPAAPDPLDQVIPDGRRALRRRTTATAVAGGMSAAVLTAAVVVPIMLTSGSAGKPASIQVAAQPTATPTPTATGPCYFKAVSRNGYVVGKKSENLLRKIRQMPKRYVDCPDPPPLPNGNGTGATPTPSPALTGPARYHYSERPQAIAARLGEELRRRVEGLGLTITYTRPFAQESSTLDSGHPAYYDGNVDVREAHGYGDVGVQVTHKGTHQVPFSHCGVGCRQTTLPDGSLLQTGHVTAGPHSRLLTAEVHRPDGVIVAAQESNYAFGPDAATQPHGGQPMTLAQLVSLAEDGRFTF